MSAAVGMLRRRVTIQRENPVAIGGGEYNANWVAVATLWGHIETINSREVLQGARLENRITHRMIMRYRPDITVAMRIFCDGNYYTIQGVLELGDRHRFTQLLLSSGGAS